MNRYSELPYDRVAWSLYNELRKKAPRVTWDVMPIREVIPVQRRFSWDLANYSPYSDQYIYVRMRVEIAGRILQCNYTAAFTQAERDTEATVRAIIYHISHEVATHIFSDKEWDNE